MEEIMSNNNGGNPNNPGLVVAAIYMVAATILGAVLETAHKVTGGLAMVVKVAKAFFPEPK